MTLCKKCKINEGNQIHYYYGDGKYRLRTGQSRVLESVENVREGTGIVCQNCVLDFRKSNLLTLNKQYLLLIVIYLPIVVYVFQTSNSFIVLQLLANIGIFVIPFLAIALIWNLATRNTIKEIHWVSLLVYMEIGDSSKRSVLMTESLFNSYQSEGKIHLN